MGASNGRVPTTRTAHNYLRDMERSAGDGVGATEKLRPFKGIYFFFKGKGKGIYFFLLENHNTK